jgi:hypothetical protein
MIAAGTELRYMFFDERHTIFPALRNGVSDGRENPNRHFRMLRRFPAAKPHLPHRRRSAASQVLEIPAKSPYDNDADEFVRHGCRG